MRERGSTVQDKPEGAAPTPGRRGPGAELRGMATSAFGREIQLEEVGGLTTISANYPPPGRQNSDSDSREASLPVECLSKDEASLSR